MQLLKETEKYLQKLGSKLKEAKSLASRFENEADEAPVEDKTVDNDDESDQAKASHLPKITFSLSLPPIFF